MSCHSLNQLNVIRNTLRPHLFHPLCGSYSTRPPDIFIFTREFLKNFIYDFASGFYRPPFLPYTLPSSGDSVMVSDGLVGVAVGSRPLVRVLISALQPICEDGIGVSAVSVRPVAAVGGGAWISLISSASWFSSAAVLFSSTSVVWLSVVMVMPVLSVVSQFGIFGEDLLVLASSCFSLSTISHLWVSQKSLPVELAASAAPVGWLPGLLWFLWWL